MRVSLRPHPDFPCEALAGLEADVARAGESLALTYVATGDIGALLIPAAAPAARADELWKHTCFEAFVRPQDGPGYVELNFAPSGRWAAYRFDGYRKGMREAQIAAPRIEAVRTEDRLSLAVEVDLAPVLGVDRPWRVALAAVVESLSGAKSYWALAHPAGRPDFHDAAGFTLELAGT